MKRLCFILAVFLTLALFSCKAEPISIDIGSAAESILEDVEFYEELYATEDGIERTLLELDESFDAEIAMYIGSGASADCVIVARADDIDTLSERVKTYLDSQEALYASYMIEEAAKIGDAVFEVKDDYLIVCITADTEGALAAVKEILG